MSELTRLSLEFGLDKDGDPLKVDMLDYPHSFVVGEGRAGMPSLLRKLLYQVREMKESRVILTDLTRVLLRDYELRSQDRYLMEVETVVAAIDELFEVVERGEDLGITFLVIGSPQLWLLDGQHPETLEKLKQLLAKGFDSSLFLIISGSLFANALYESLAYDFDVRVMLGRVDGHIYESVFGLPVEGFTTGKRGFGQLKVGDSAPVEFTI